MVATTTSASPKRLVIASRESRLAMWQALHVQSLLQQLYPACEVTILGMTTQGDQILDRALSKVGGKGLFVKELEVALAEGRADLAVHSLKDVPMELPEGFSLTAIMEREDPRDAFVSNDYARLEDLPAGAVVGTSSLRREAALRARFPHLVIQPLRGNLDTRLGKLDKGDYAAIILAAAGLKRLGLKDRIRDVLPTEQSLPAAGQGALGIEIRSDRADVAAALMPLHHQATACAVWAERAVSRVLGGSCQVPLAAFAQWVSSDEQAEDKISEGAAIEAVLELNAFVASTNGQQVLTAQISQAVHDEAGASAMGREVAQALMAQGAEKILAEVLQATQANVAQ